MTKTKTYIQKKEISSFQTFVMAARPKTLSISCVPIFVGTFLALGQVDSIRWGLALFALICAFSIQIGINIINDAMDFKKGADGKDRLGPKRVTQSGLMSYSQVLYLGIACFIFASLCGIPLILQGGWPLLTALAASIVFGYLYTGGPFPLAYLGLGELFVLIFFGYVITFSAFYLQTGFINFTCFLAATQIGLLAMVTIAINNTRDIVGDLQAKKMTLSANFGLNFSRYEIAILSFLPYFLGVIWIFNGHPLMYILPFLALPLVYKNVVNIWVTHPSSLYNEYLARSAQNQLFFGLLLITGYIIAL